jgi:2-polyprenyl-6-methoxyphenol hydroxylase-like FAD-dependent oxidoreductase
MSGSAVGGVDVLVVGAGPTGLTMASEVARHGLSCRVVDKAPAPSDKSKALVVQARTIEVFEAMGLAERFLTAGERMRAINFYVKERRIARMHFEGLDSPYPYPLIIEQSATERILGEHLAGLGLTVERRVELAGFTVGEDEVSATLRHPDGGTEAVRARWLLGCDGAHSTVRHALELPFEGAPYEEDFILGDVRLEWSLPEREGHGFLARGELLVALPMRGEQRFRLIARRSQVHPNRGQDPTLEEFQELIDQASSVRAVLSDPVWLASFRLQRRIVPQLRQGRIFLAGDAAHIHSPAGGQGMNTGIQDAFNLAWKLALVHSGAARPGLLDSYQAERYPVAKAVLRGTDLLFRVALGNSGLVRLARRWVAPLVINREWIQRRLRGFISELQVNYRSSPIVGGTTWAAFRAGPQPGDRAPDATVVPAGSRSPTHLFELWRGTRHTLVLYGSPGDAAFLEEIGKAVRERHAAHVAVVRIVADQTATAGSHDDGPVLLDSEESFQRRYGAQPPCLYLVRPDGYLAYRGQPADAEGLKAYLDRIFVRVASA